MIQYSAMNMFVNSNEVGAMDLNLHAYNNLLLIVMRMLWKKGRFNISELYLLRRDNTNLPTKEDFLVLAKMLNNACGSIEQESAEHQD